MSIEKGRLEQCLTWLASYLTDSELTPRLNTLSYGSEKQVYQIFRKRQLKAVDKPNHGWFMVNQFLPAEGRGASSHPFVISDNDGDIIGNNTGMVLIDDSGVPPQVCDGMVELNPGLWCIAMGISVAHWQQWAVKPGERFTLFCRLSDLETTRMEMDASVNWETIVAMCLRALRTPEVGLWDSNNNRFVCHIVVEMFPHGILYLGSEGAPPGKKLSPQPGFHSLL